MGRLGKMRATTISRTATDRNATGKNATGRRTATTRTATDRIATARTATDHTVTRYNVIRRTATRHTTARRTATRHTATQKRRGSWNFLAIVGRWHDVLPTTHARPRTTDRGPDSGAQPRPNHQGHNNQRENLEERQTTRAMIRGIGRFRTTTRRKS